MKAKLIVMIFALVIATFVVGCKSKENAIPIKPSETLTPRSGKRAIVFIHGIHGSAADTWRSADGKAYWPDLIKADPAFKDADVFVEQYPTPYTGNKKDVTDISNALEEQLRNIFQTHDQVVFICHSLGGLVFKQMLLDHQAYAKQIPFVVFYATPGAGSFIARFGSFFSGDPLLKSMSNSGDNLYLLELEKRWRAFNPPIKRYCAYENQKMRPRNLAEVITVSGPANAGEKLADFVGGIYVVDPFSATYGCDSSSTFTAIESNHIGIVKPDTQSDLIYTLFKSYYSGAPSTQNTAEPIRFAKTICAFYGESNQGNPAWNKDEECPIPDIEHLDLDYQQTNFICCGGGATSHMNAASVPKGFELQQIGGGYYWSIDQARVDGSTFKIHTYCGPSGGFGGGCNVKGKVIAHYKIDPSEKQPLPQ
jgi:hypothetical protein